MPFSGNESHDISLADAARLTRAHRTAVPKPRTHALFYSRDALMKLLNQNLCVGIRCYFGRDAGGEQVLVLTGVDSQGNDIVGVDSAQLEFGLPCPPFCDTANSPLVY